MSRNLVLIFTAAPASRHTRAEVRSMGTARERSLSRSGTCRSVLTSDVQSSLAFAPCLRDHQREAQPFQHDNTENVRFHFEL